MTRIVKVGGGREGGIKDHSQLSVGATGESMLSFSNKGETQGEGIGDRGAKRNKINK